MDEITAKSVRQTVIDMKNDKSPGQGGVPMELIKHVKGAPYYQNERNKGRPQELLY